MKKTGLFFLWISVLVFVIDLATKFVVTQNLELYESIAVFPLFNLTYVRNYGAAFSFLADHDGWQRYFFILLSCVISLILIYFLYRNNAQQRLVNSSYALVIGGALGNMVDRAYNGFVVDFFDFYWDIYHYPVFNVADIAICLGVGGLILDSFYQPKQRDKS